VLRPLNWVAASSEGRLDPLATPECSSPVSTVISALCPSASLRCAEWAENVGQPLDCDGHAIRAQSRRRAGRNSSPQLPHRSAGDMQRSVGEQEVAGVELPHAKKRERDAALQILE
jgi:hypothetical protein